VDSIRAAVERRDGNVVVHRKVAPELVIRESTRRNFLAVSTRRN